MKIEEVMPEFNFIRGKVLWALDVRLSARGNSKAARCSDNQTTKCLQLQHLLKFAQPPRINKKKV